MTVTPETDALFAFANRYQSPESARGVAGERGPSRARHAAAAALMRHLSRGGSARSLEGAIRALRQVDIGNSARRSLMERAPLRGQYRSAPIRVVLPPLN